MSTKPKGAQAGYYENTNKTISPEKGDSSKEMQGEVKILCRGAHPEKRASSREEGLSSLSEGE